VSDLFLYDDLTARTFEPFALTRPTSELRAGALLLRERWELCLGGGAKAAGIVTAPHLADFEEPWSVGVVSGVLKKGSVLANSRCAVGLSAMQAGDFWTCGDRVAAVTLSRDVLAAELASGELSLEKLARDNGRRVDLPGGRWIEHVWDFIRFLTPMLSEDVAVLSNTAIKLGRTDSLLAGPHGVFIEDGGAIEPHVYFDTTAGPVLIRRGATVQAFTRISGPCVIGADSTVGGDKVASCSVGDACKVHGEVSTSIFLGHSNKGHDGFLGHSYLGRWVNLGAGTITSNLKNTYGSVQLWTPQGEHDTGMQFLGTLFGDHAKTGIGTSLNTGTVIGAGANLYGSVMPPKMVPPFAWGDRKPYSTYRMDKFLEVAKRVMERRHVELTPRQGRLFSAAGERAKGWGGSAS